MQNVCYTVFNGEIKILFIGITQNTTFALNIRYFRQQLISLVSRLVYFLTGMIIGSNYLSSLIPMLSKNSDYYITFNIMA